MHPGKRPLEADEEQSRKAARADMEKMVLGSISSVPSGILKAAVMVMKGVDITEVFSPERVVAEAKKYGLTAGLSMDLTNGWEFRSKEHRRKAKEYVRSQKPLLVI